MCRLCVKSDTSFLSLTSCQQDYIHVFQLGFCFPLRLHLFMENAGREIALGF